jgi:hypothetical protein
MRTRALVLGSFSIVLTIVFFTFFRGMSNFLNAFLVPTTLYIFLKELSHKEMVTVFFAALLMVLFLYQLQTIFFIFYGLVALLLIELNKKHFHWIFNILVLSICLSLSFYLATVITDFIFLTRIRSFTIVMAGGSPIVYAMYLSAFGFVVGSAMIIAVRLLTNRKKTWRLLK